MATQTGFSIMFGTKSLDQDLPSSKFCIKAVTHKKQIDQFHQNIHQKLQLKNIPFITLRTPQYLDSNQIPFFHKWINDEFQINQMKAQTLNKFNSKFYFFNPRNPEDQALMFIKKIDKVFSQLNTTQKQILLQSQIFQLQNRINQLKSKGKPLAPWSIIFNQSYFCARASLSGQFWEMLNKLMNKISPKFANSPIMAMLPLMTKIRGELRLDSVDELDQQLRDMFMGQINEQLYNKIKEKKTKDAFKTDTQVQILISFGMIGYLQVKIDTYWIPILAAIQNMSL